MPSISPLGARSRLRAEYVLAGLAVLSLALVPIHITTIYSGLPAHPLFLHVPVILIPVAAVWALVLVARPAWFMRSGVLLGILTVVALAGTFLTVGAGEALPQRASPERRVRPGGADRPPRPRRDAAARSDDPVHGRGDRGPVRPPGRRRHGQRLRLARRPRAPPGRADPPAHRARGPGDPVRLLRVPRRRPRAPRPCGRAACPLAVRAVAADPCTSCSAPAAVEATILPATCHAGPLPRGGP